ncbi:hypothetical protein BH20CHL5_BH20CHL5_14310 [soil metagenome]
MTAPTEQDVRASLEAFLEANSPMSVGTMRDALREAIRDVGDALDCAAYTALESEGDVGDDAPDSLWRDLRRSEARHLRELVTGGIDAAASRCEAIILEELTAAGVTFAAQHPDAPRPVIR